MFTESYRFDHHFVGRDWQVDVDPGLLKCWWSASSGPQTAEGVVAAHLRTVEQMILDKIATCSIDPAARAVELNSLDYETELDEYDCVAVGLMH